MFIDIYFFVQYFITQINIKKWMMGMISRYVNILMSDLLQHKYTVLHSYASCIALYDRLFNAIFK